jgi:hypothetical protein
VDDAGGVRVGGGLSLRGGGNGGEQDKG